jgi:hypothetical protein
LAAELTLGGGDGTGSGGSLLTSATLASVGSADGWSTGGKISCRLRSSNTRSIVGREVHQQMEAVGDLLRL